MGADLWTQPTLPVGPWPEPDLPVCDFCLDPTPTWEHACESFTLRTVVTADKQAVTFDPTARPQDQAILSHDRRDPGLSVQWAPTPHVSELVAAEVIQSHDTHYLGGWGLCDTCHGLVQEEAWSKLVRRLLRMVWDGTPAHEMHLRTVVTHFGAHRIDEPPVRWAAPGEAQP